MGSRKDTNMNNEKLVNEIVDEAEKLPLECQEKILDMVKAMAFTRNVINKENTEQKNMQKD